jgi:hypothetical protein
VICKVNTNPDLNEAIRKLANAVSQPFAFFSLNLLKRKAFAGNVNVLPNAIVERLALGRKRKQFPQLSKDLAALRKSENRAARTFEWPMSSDAPVLDLIGSSTSFILLVSFREADADSVIWRFSERRAFPCG